MSGELDYDALAERLKQGGPELEAVGERLGLKLSPSDLAALQEALNLGWGPTLAQTLAELHRAIRDPKGFSYQRRGIGSRPTHVLAVCTDEEVTFGYGRSRVSTRLEAVWPELEGWKKNPELLKQWARGTKDRVKLRRGQTPQPPAPADAAQTDGLMRAIVERPDDDAARLVYADALLERGDPHGDLIRLQVTAEAKPTPPNKQELTYRASQLLRTSWKAFAGEAEPFTGEYGFRRGFAEKLTMTVPKFEKLGERLFTQTPARALSFKKPLSEAELERLARVPALEHVRELAFDYSPPGMVPRILAPFAKTRGLKRLERLTIRFAGESAADWGVFFTELQAPQLTVLRLQSRFFSPIIYSAIAGNPLLQKLRVLSCDVDETIRDEADRLFARLAGHTSLEEVRVWYHRDLGDGIAALFGPDAVCRLKKLELHSCRATGALLEAIDSPRGEGLVELGLRNTEITAGEALAFLRSTHLPSLERLLIWHDARPFTVAEFDALHAAAKALPKLKDAHFGRGKG
ncbi:MAG: TIGR02996 domain-containing protein [Myxococcaceae bacterium]